MSPCAFVKSRVCSKINYIIRYVKDQPLLQKPETIYFSPTGFLDLQAIQKAQPTQIYHRDDCLLSSLICQDALISCIEEFKRGQFHI